MSGEPSAEPRPRFVEPLPTLGQRAEIARLVFGEPRNMAVCLGDCLTVLSVIRGGEPPTATSSQAAKIRVEAQRLGVPLA